MVGKLLKTWRAPEVATSAPNPMVSQTSAAVAVARPRSVAAPSSRSGSGLRRLKPVQSSRNRMAMAESRCGAAQPGGGETTPGCIPVSTMYQP